MKQRERKPRGRNKPDIPESIVTTATKLYSTDFHWEGTHNSAISNGSSTTPGLPTLTLASSTHGRVRKAMRKVTEYAEATLTVQSQKEQQAAWKSTRLRKAAGRIQ